MTIILAIIGTLIVVVVGIFLYSKFSGSSVFGPGAPTPTIALTTPEPTPEPSPTMTLPPIVTPEPTPEPSPSVDLLAPTPDPAATTAPPVVQKNYETVTVAVAKLKVRSTAGSSGGDLGSVSYGQTFEVFAESGKWVQIRYNNTYGWIYTGVDSSGDKCAVRGNTPIPSMPEPDAAPSFLDSVSVSGNVLTVKFKTGVYGNKEHTAGLSASQLTVKEGGNTISYSIAHTAGSNTATLTIGPTGGGAITVSVAGNTIYNSVGTASPSGSVSTGTSSDSTPPTFSLSLAGNIITVTFNEAVYGEANKTGDLGDGDFSISGSYSAAGSVSGHSAGGKTVTITLSGHTPGEVITVNVKSGAVYDAAGNSASASNPKTVTLAVG